MARGAGDIRLRTGVVLAAAVVIFGTDALVSATDLPFALQGVLDEFAHAATALLALAALGRLPAAPFATAALVASVAIDIDHVPGHVFGVDALTAGAPRPYSHSLLTVTALAAAGVGASGIWRRGLLGAALGVSLHFVRDLGYGGGVPLLWPASWAGVTVPYAAYAALVVVLAGLAAARGPSRVRPGRRSSARGRPIPVRDVR